MATKKDIEQCNEQIESTFSLFDALEKNAEAWVDGLYRQRTLAIEELNKTIAMHNNLVEKRLRIIPELCKEIDESNDKIQRVYERATEVFELLQKRLDETMEEE